MLRIKAASWLLFAIFLILLLAKCQARPNRQFERIKKAPTCGYDSCAKTDDKNLINVHLVAHTHDDVGWLKTVDQYYYGSKSNIQKAGVQYILDSVVASLLDDPKKKFIYVESAFFFKWWREQTPELQDKVKMLVSEGRLEFIGGAWSMNDEATTIYQSTIDQFTWGLRRLNDTFGECGRPKVGWQIDPFGHSREQASLFAQMSFDGYFFGRLHYQDKARRLQNKEMEMVWQASDNLGEAAEIFTGALYNTYSPPAGFCWDVLCSDEPFVDNKHSKDYNVDRLLNNFFEYAANVSRGYRSNNILITMGEDFNYQDANMWFTNIDKLIKYGNALQSQGSKYNFIYSTPSCYLKSLKEANQTWPTYSQDFFPYASDETAVWTGYFTSRPTVKRYERMGNHFLQVCKQLTSVAFLKNFAKRIDSYGGGGKSLNAHLTFLREQMGVMQHHDAVTGTEKQHVADDYMRNVFIALKACNYNAKIILNELTKPSDGNLISIGSQKRDIKFLYGPHENMPMQPKLTFEFDSCHLLNVSRCHISESNDKFMVTVYNPLAHSTHQPVRFPVAHPNYQVRDYRKVPVQIQMVPITDRARQIPTGEKSNAEFEIVFLAQEIPPLGYKSYFVEAHGESQSESPKPYSGEDEIVVVLLQNDSSARKVPAWEKPKKDADITIGNSHIQATFNTATGYMTTVVVDGEAQLVTQEFFYYNAAAGDNYKPEKRASGAYILRPNGTEILTRLKGKVDIQVVRGEVVDEVYQKFNDYITQVVRIYHDNSSASGIEFSWTVGPIPVDDRVGKEIVSRFTSSVINCGVFYTDSNGREMLKRTRNNEALWKDELVAINYYPINSKIYIEDEYSRMAILTDRAQGATSLRDGVIDVLVHRRLLVDDAFGVGEALNETQYGQGLVATGTLKLLVNSWENASAPTAAAKERFLQNRMLLPNWLFFSTVNDTYEDWQSKYRNIASHLALSLPQNVYLMTMEPWRENSYLVRFEHILEKDDDGNYSKSVTFTLQDVFATLFDIESVRETNLAANQWLSDVKRFKFTKDQNNPYNRRQQEEDNETYPERREEPIAEDDESHTITLSPMQIRTFIITVNEQL